MKTNPWKRLLLSSAWLLVAGASAPLAQAQSISLPVVPRVGFAISNLASGLVLTYELPAPRAAENELGQPIWVLEDFLLDDPEFQMHLLKVTLDPDPSISFAFSVTDFGAPTTFIFGFFTPIVPTFSPNEVSASIEGFLTDARDDGVSLTLVNPHLLVGDLNAPPTNAGVDVGPAASFGPSGFTDSEYLYGPYNAGPQPGPGPGPWTGLSGIIAFGLGGDNDRAEFGGNITILPSSGVVPEPGTWAAAGLLGAGLVGGALRRRMRACA